MDFYRATVFIEQPAGLHYSRCVSPSEGRKHHLVGQALLMKMLITLYTRNTYCMDAYIPLIQTVIHVQIDICMSNFPQHAAWMQIESKLKND